jgi:hypothetical protein
MRDDQMHFCNRLEDVPVISGKGSWRMKSKTFADVHNGRIRPIPNHFAGTLNAENQVPLFRKKPKYNRLSHLSLDKINHFRKHDIRYLGIVIIIITCSASAVYGKTPVNEAKSANKHQELRNMFQTPVTPRAFLTNLRYAIDHDLLLQREFFTAENLKWLIGTYTSKDTDESSDYRISKKFFCTPKNSSNGCIESGEFYSFDVYRSPIFEGKKPVNIKKEMTGGISCQIKNTKIMQDDPAMTPICREFTIDLVTEIFGPPNRVSTKFERDGFPNANATFVYGHQSHKWGNSWVEYKQACGGREVNMRFSVLGNGVVDWMDIKMRKTEYLDHTEGVL